MGKGKTPRQPKAPPPDESTPDEEPEREPVALRQRRPAAPSRPALFDLIQTIRAAVGAMLDIADAAAEAIKKRIEGRA